MTPEIEWVELSVVLAYHNRQIAEHGGSEGVRDQGLLESALGRPQNLIAYGGDEVDLAALAAAYAFGIARNHAFIDGNKRTALVVSIAFLNLNGYNLDAERKEIFIKFLSLAQGNLTEEDLADWFRNNIVRI